MKTLLQECAEAVARKTDADMMETLHFPVSRLTKEIPCGKCGRPVSVNERTVMAFCGDCTKGMGQKK
jgi:Zn finger protein HypA/HybF involved in hydrogenase expression